MAAILSVCALWHAYYHAIFQHAGRRSLRIRMTKKTQHKYGCACDAGYGNLRHICMQGHDCVIYALHGLLLHCSDTTTVRPVVIKQAVCTAVPGLLPIASYSLAREAQHAVVSFFADSRKSTVCTNEPTARYRYFHGLLL